MLDNLLHVPYIYMQDASPDVMHDGRDGKVKETTRALSEIASEIRRTWMDKQGHSNVHYAARPYLDAMRSLTLIGDNYGADGADDIVLYFLSNATSWRGDDARRIKAELKAMLPR